MKFVDYYAVMGLDPEAKPDEIRKAYRRLARKYHPDVSKEKDAEEKFKQLGEAYEVLKDPARRAEYDDLRRYGAGGTGGEFRPPPGWQPRSGAGPLHEEMDPHTAQRFSDFFEAIFGRAGPEPVHPGGMSWPGEDIHHELRITLEEAQHGGSRTISLEGPPGPGGVRHAPRVLKVNIPKGIRAGQQVRLKGQGYPGMQGGRAGDLFLHIEYAPHRHFSVDGRDLTLVLPVAPWEAVLGTSVTVPTLERKVKLAIPANSQAGRKLRLAGKGLAGPPDGDLYVVLQIVVPAEADTAQRNLWARLGEESRFNPRTAWGE